MIDSLPVMLARGGHAYTATVARETADVGYCASKKQYFHGVRLHAIARRRSGQLPAPNKSGCVKLPATTCVASKSKRRNCRPRRCLLTAPTPIKRLSNNWPHKVLLCARQRKDQKVKNSVPERSTTIAA